MREPPHEPDGRYGGGRLRVRRTPWASAAPSAPSAPGGTVGFPGDRKGAAAPGGAPPVAP